MKFYPYAWVMATAAKLRPSLRGGDSYAHCERVSLELLEDLLPRIEAHLVGLIEQAAIDRPELLDAARIVERELR